jgi:hypothetical protein
LWQHIAKRGLNDTKKRSKPVVYFNLDSEILPILRSTLGLVCNSQLGIRISGRWKELEEADDIDKDGNLIISSSIIHL